VQERVALLDASTRHRVRGISASDVFIAMLSHELRNPLSAIAAAGELLSGWASRPKHRCRRAGSSGARPCISRGSSTIYSTSRISAGKMTLHREPVDLAEAIANALQAPQRTTRARAPVDRKAERLVDAIRTG
jgi:signal transduction histidine kinase